MTGNIDTFDNEITRTGCVRNGLVRKSSKEFYKSYYFVPRVVLRDDKIGAELVMKWFEAKRAL